MSENLPDRRRAEAFDRERLVALSSLLRNGSRVINFTCLVSTH